MNDPTLRSPVNGTFELTGRCNLSCRMCLVRVDQKRIQDLQLRERTAQEWIDMARQAAQAGTLTLLLTGGEVMLRPDFCEIYAAIAKMGFVLTVYTNATLVTDQVMELFRAYPPHKIGVTMYGASNQTYQRLCGCPDGYDRFVTGLDRLAPAGDAHHHRPGQLDRFGDHATVHQRTSGPGPFPSDQPICHQGHPWQRHLRPAVPPIARRECPSGAQRFGQTAARRDVW